MFRGLTVGNVDVPDTLRNYEPLLLWLILFMFFFCSSKSVCVFVLCSRATLFTSGNCDVFL